MNELTCPKCQSNSLTKCGSANGKQRYKCADCGITTATPTGGLSQENQERATDKGCSLASACLECPFSFCAQHERHRLSEEELVLIGAAM